MDQKAHDTPSDISAEEGEVMVDGPNGFAYSFTPEAALETSERLRQGGLMAQGQKMKGRKRKPAGDADQPAARD